MVLESVWWSAAEDGRPAAAGYIDQRAIPHEVRRERAVSIDDVVSTIATLAVRGAPAIGIFGAYGVALARELYPHDDAAYRAAAARIRAARPTAVNLAWAVDRVLASDRAPLDEAREIHDEQRAVDRAIGEHGAPLMPDRGAVLTHCNTGPLATGGTGTALGVFVTAHEAGKKLHVYADETRPLLQGARLTTFELAQAGVPVTLIADGAAAATMRLKNVVAVVVGADRIARNGDTANKIGTYAVAIAAAHHGIPFYVAAPRSTIDFDLRDGDGIEIEERSASELRAVAGTPTAPRDVAVFNPAFDVTPGRLIAGIITEYGVARPPYEESIPDLATRPAFGLLPR
ncbi:MAG: S-methyl-5-thioribose-1-phosphate isomerase [Candidatus Eremiobacteraeota bacterium]|nr:S-methyl-5-thioribose-1-phosphate isomerase [Candidatus Eremiobacteraeota bacterium]